MKVLFRIIRLCKICTGVVCLLLISFSSLAQIKPSQNIYIKFKESSALPQKTSSKVLTKEMIPKKEGVKGIQDLQSLGNGNVRLRKDVSALLKNIHKIQLDENANEKDLIEYFKSFDNVEEVVLEPKVEILYVPNDPNHTMQDYLALVHAYEAWDITKGSESVVLGISDTGVDYGHEDLMSNRYFNELDPVNGLDDDGNGYIDDYIGYDLADDDTDPFPDTDPHGSMVCGVAAASTDNSLGISGVGFNSKYFPIKVFESAGNESAGTYESILYAANLGLDVINLSWGGVGEPSSIFQDIINYAVLENDMVVVAAAGNTNAELEFYPASYDHVLSVGASGDNDGKADFATYSHQIDLMAPGKGMYSTRNSNNYGTDSGSSYAAPMVTGTAALIRGLFPTLNAVQVMERIRMTSDDVYDISNNMDFYGKLGKGRLNMLRAVSEENVAAVRKFDFAYHGPTGHLVFFGDTVTVNLRFVNVLRNVEGLEIDISTTSTYAQLLNDHLWVGSMNTLDSTEVFEIKILLSENTPYSERLIFRMEYKDANGYEDFEYLEFNTTGADFPFGNSKIELAISSNGDLASESDDGQNSVNYYAETVADFMGFMVGNHVDSISDNLILNYTTFEKQSDFEEYSRLKQYPHEAVDYYARNRFTDGAANKANGFLIEQEFLAFEDSQDEDYLILEYFITNTTEEDRPDMRAGLFMDVDLEEPGRNFANWEASSKLGYATSDVAGGLMTGLALISSHGAIFHAIDLFDQDGLPLDIDGTITEPNKYDFLYTEKTTAGDVNGHDVALSLAADLGTLAGKSSSKIAFAMVFGNTLQELIDNVNKAKLKYQSFLEAPAINLVVASCQDIQIDLQNSESIALYADPLGLDWIETGTNLSIDGLAQDSSFFYRELTGNYASDLYRLQVDIFEHQLDFTADPAILYLDDDPAHRVQFMDESLRTVEWSWDFDNGAFSTLKNPKTTYNQTGNYNVQVSIVTDLGCTASYSEWFEVKERGDAPLISGQIICKGETVTISATDLPALNFYENQDDELPFFSGTEWISGPIGSTVTYYVSSIAQAEESIKVPVLIEVDEIVANFAFTQDIYDFSSGQLMGIHDQSTNAATISWQINGQGLGDGLELTYNYAGLSTLEIKQIVTSHLGCADSLVMELALVQSPTPAFDDIEICKWGTALFAPEPGGKFVFYADENLAQIIGKGDSFSMGSVHSDTAIYITNISDYIESEAVKVDIRLIDFDPVIIATPDSLILSKFPNAGFSALGEDIVKYRWYLNDVLVEAAASPTLTFDSLGTYQVTLVSRNSIGCVDTAHLTYKVFEILGINDQLNRLALFPNPTFNQLHLNHPYGTVPNGLSIHNAIGQSFHVKMEQAEGSFVLSTDALSPGIYFLSGEIGGIRFSEKFIKR